MKKQRRLNIIALLVIISASSFLTKGQSQIFPITFEDDLTYTWVDFGGATTSIISNPNATGINTSAKVSKVIKSGGEDWAGAFLSLKTKVDFNIHKELKLKVYVPAIGTKVTLKLEDAVNNTINVELSTTTTKANEWEELVFNFTNADLSQAYQKLVVFFDLGTVGDGSAASTYYIDDIEHPGVDYEDDTNGGGDVVVADSFDLSDYTMIWSDEFDIDGAINSEKWFHQTQLPAGGSWFNGEVQHYTNRLENSYVENGVLKLVAKKESFTDQGVTKQYTSARLNSKFAFTYGRVEVKAKLPSGVGTWPAIWMLGKNISEAGAYWETQGYGTTGWPACGEIDIMEHWGHNENVVSSAMHTPSSYGGTVNTGHQTISNATSEFHIYAMDWDADAIVFTVDGKEHYRYAPAVKNDETWPYHHDQYLLLNIAIQPSISPSFTQSSMDIDYVRVFQKKTSGIHNKNKNHLTIYPNPSSDLINISSPNKIQNIVIYNSAGKKIITQMANTHQLQTSIVHLKKGPYLLQVYGLENIEYQIIIKQ